MLFSTVEQEERFLVAMESMAQSYAALATVPEEDPDEVAFRRAARLEEQAEMQMRAASRQRQQDLDAIERTTLRADMIRNLATSVMDDTIEIDDVPAGLRQKVQSAVDRYRVRMGI
jgi:predicted glycosyltransferase